MSVLGRGPFHTGLRRVDAMSRVGEPKDEERTGRREISSILFLDGRAC